MPLISRFGVLLGAAAVAAGVGWVLQFLWAFAVPVLSQSPQQRSSPLQWLLLASMALAAPLLADCIHTLNVVSGGIRLYNAELARIHEAGFWIFCGGRSALTFLLLWPFAKVPLRHRTMWICCVVLWVYLDFQAEVAFR